MERGGGGGVLRELRHALTDTRKKGGGGKTFTFFFKKKNLLHFVCRRTMSCSAFRKEGGRISFGLIFVEVVRGGCLLV